MGQNGFNPKARWDRSMPIDNHNPEFLNERIEVLAWFKGGKIHPRMFMWNNKEYKINKVNYNWQERQGEAVINYFSVDTGANLYQISFSNTALSWRIDKIIQ